MQQTNGQYIQGDVEDFVKDIGDGLEYEWKTSIIFRLDETRIANTALI